MLELLKYFQFNFGYSLLLFCVYFSSISDRSCFGRPGRSILSDEDYPEEVTYPFQQYIQVRKEYTVEHLPSPSHTHDAQSPRESPHPSNLEPSSSNRESAYDNEQASDDYEEQDDKESHHDDRKSKYKGQDERSSESEYTKPRLREEIEDYKKQEVYEEKGNSDGAYDHQGYGYGESHHNPNPKYEHADHHEHHNHNEPSSSSHNGEHRHIGGDDDSQNDNYTPEESESSLRKVERKRNRQVYTSLHPEDGTSTKLLEYAASNLYDRDAHEKGSIYRARDNIYCPEVIDFDLSSKKMRMGEGGNNPRGAKPRLVGLGGKITCLKNKYFKKETLPKAIFLDPEESRQSVISIPTWEQFYKNVRTDVGSMSNFQRF